jgi:hypothetical protein
VGVKNIQVINYDGFESQQIEPCEIRYDAITTEEPAISINKVQQPLLSTCISTPRRRTHILKFSP